MLTPLHHAICPRTLLAKPKTVIKGCRLHDSYWISSFPSGFTVGNVLLLPLLLWLLLLLLLVFVKWLFFEMVSFYVLSVSWRKEQGLFLLAKECLKIIFLFLFYSLHSKRNDKWLKNVKLNFCYLINPKFIKHAILSAFSVSNVMNIRNSLILNAMFYSRFTSVTNTSPSTHKIRCNTRTICWLGGKCQLSVKLKRNFCLQYWNRKIRFMHNVFLTIPSWEFHLSIRTTCAKIPNHRCASMNTFDPAM